MSSEDAAACWGGAVAFDFSGKIAIVAGAASGIGRRIALDLLGAGASVVGADLAEEPSEARGAERWQYRQGDLSQEASVAGAVDLAAGAFGGIDLVANTVGVLWFDRDTSMTEVDEAVWDRVLAINLKPVVWLARHAAPQMRRRGGGAFVHFSSIDATGGDLAPQDAYGASKAAMIRMSRSIAVQFARDRIRSNAILPGPVLTPMQRRWEQSAEALAHAASDVPLGRVGTPADMAAAALFLLSDMASFITGTELVVDGGLTAGV